MDNRQVFSTIWEANIGKYLTIKIQQGNKGDNDIILYVANGNKYIWQHVDKEEFFNSWNNSRRSKFVPEQINNSEQLRYTIQHAVFDAVKSATPSYRKEIYHDIPNVLMGIAEMEDYGERYVNILMRRKTRKQYKPQQIKE